MAGLVPAIQTRRDLWKRRSVDAVDSAPMPRSWMAGTSPAMTIGAKGGRGLASDLHILARRIPQRLQRALGGVTGGDHRARLGLQPLRPVRPPRAGRLDGVGLPGLQGGGEAVVGPVLVLLRHRGVDDAG